MLRRVVFVLALAAAAPAQAGQQHQFERTIRASDPGLRELIRDVRAISPTFRRLIARLERSDVIVYVMRQHDIPVALDGQLTFMTQAGGTRYLKIGLAWDRPYRRLVPALAHEIQHAVEVADADDVVDDASLARAYTRRGGHGLLTVAGTMSFETQEAIDAGARVWREYHSAGAAAD